MFKGKMINRFLSAFLIAAMAVTMLPGTTFADGISGNNMTKEEAVSDNQVIEEEKAVNDNPVVEEEAVSDQMDGEEAVSDNQMTGEEAASDQTAGEEVISDNDIAENNMAANNMPIVTGSEEKDSTITGSVTAMPQKAWEALNGENNPAYAGVSLNPQGAWAIGEDKKVTLTGELSYVIGFTDYAMEKERQQGYYAAIRIPISDEAAKTAATASGTIVTVKTDTVATYDKEFAYNEESGLIEREAESYYMDLIIRLNLADPSFTIAFDWDGTGTEYRATEYTFSTNQIKYEKKPSGSIDDSDWMNILSLDKGKINIKDGMGVRYVTKIPYTILLEENAEKLNFLDEGGNLITEGHFVVVSIVAPESLGSNLSGTTYSYDEEEARDWDAIYAGSLSFKHGIHVTKEDMGTTKTLKVNWRGEYEETYFIEFAKDIVLGANTEETVAPKSLTFVSPEKNMYIGKEQQLSVKVTRNQAADRVRYDFSSSDPAILAVDDKGNVIAKKVGTAEITVFAVDKNGQPMKDNKGKDLKSAKVKITVKDVTAPAKLKVEYRSEKYARISWNINTTGNEFEIYVLEGKKKIADFETAIEAENEPLEPTKRISDPSQLGSDFSDLEKDTVYTAYVRNVYVEDASVLSAKGSVVSFKTTKTLPTTFSFYDENEKQVLQYTHDTSKGNTFQVRVRHSYPVGTKEEDKEYKSNYKFRYTIADNSIASIDKNGKVTVKGAGEIDILVEDNSTKKSIRLIITATATQISKKTTKLSVGQSVDMGTLVKFDYEGIIKEFDEKTIDAFRQAADKEKKPLFKVTESSEADGGYTIQAIRTGNATIEMTAKDIEKPATATIKISQLEAPQIRQSGDYPVYVSDTEFMLDLLPNPYAEYYKVELLKGKKEIVDSCVVSEFSPAGEGRWQIYSGSLFGELQENTTYYVRITSYFGDDQTSKAVTSKAIKTTKTISLSFDLYEVTKDDSYEIRNEEILGLKVGGTKALWAELKPYVMATESDTLIWKSSNPKVATIKANKSSYGAQITGVKTGEATITITSKATKKEEHQFTVQVKNEADSY